LAGSKAEIYQTVRDGNTVLIVKIVESRSQKLSTGAYNRKEPSHDGTIEFENEEEGTRRLE
jgi:hypothetical protein